MVYMCNEEDSGLSSTLSERAITYLWSEVKDGIFGNAGIFGNSGILGISKVDAFCLYSVTRLST